jgi:hypothetical protein
MKGSWVFVLILALGMASSPAAFSRESFQSPQSFYREGLQYSISPIGDDGLIETAGRGFARAIRLEKSAWYDCGKITPKDEYDYRGIQLASALRKALLDVGLKDPMYLWGALALVFHESRGNPCVTGPTSRQWVDDNKLLKKEKHWTKYDQFDILRIVKSKAFKSKRSGIDSGISQTLYPRNTKIFEVTSGIVRQATIEEMLTVEGGARATAQHMMERFKDSSEYPWLFWPGYRDDRYLSVLQFHVRRMGGPYTDLGPVTKKWSRPKKYSRPLKLTSK